ncbi:MAG: hypothetical protein PHS86_12080 [Syntrophaceae bacterium]|nr:hypothetical protein [Syntrophaceae bacterium]
MSIDIESWRDETEISVKIAISKVKDVLKQVKPENIQVENANDLYKVSNSLASLAKSIEAIERSSRDRHSLLAQVGEEIKAEIRSLLAGEPELIAEVLEVVEHAKNRLQIES